MACTHTNKGLYFERENSVVICKCFILPTVTSALGSFSVLICTLTVFYQVSKVYDTQYWRLKDKKAVI
jgi:hypothetical protein